MDENKKDKVNTESEEMSEEQPQQEILDAPQEQAPQQEILDAPQEQAPQQEALDAPQEQAPQQEAPANKKRKKLKIAISIVLAVVIVAAGLLVYLNWFSGVSVSNLSGSELKQLVETSSYYAGISVDGIDISGLTLNDAADKLTQHQQEKLEGISFHLKSDDGFETITGKDVFVSSNLEEVLEKAMYLGRDGTLLERNAEIQTLKDEGVNLEISYVYSFEQIQDRLSKDIKKYNKEAIEPQIVFNQENEDLFDVEEGVAGREVNTEKLFALIEQSIQNGFTDIEIPFEEIQPTQTAAEVLASIVLRADYFSQFSTSNKPRSANIRKSVDIINGKQGYHLLKPGEEFSLNGVLGKRNKENGWNVAGAYQQGKTVQQYGGGVCQISSTLYNAALRADLVIVERQSHSMPVGYIKPPWDATLNLELNDKLSQHNIDLKLQNGTDSDIYIFAYVDGNKIGYRIYGKPMEWDEIKLEGKLKRTIGAGSPKVTVDKSLAPGSTVWEVKQRNGAEWDTWRVYFKDGKEVSREELPTSLYRAYAGEYRVGPAPVAQPEAPAAQPEAPAAQPEAPPEAAAG